MGRSDGNISQSIAWVLAILSLAVTPQAQAFCIHNQTDTRLFFMVEPSGIKVTPAITFQTWIDAGKSKCCDWSNKSCNPAATTDARMSFYAFDAVDALEGCDSFGRADSNITLNEFIRFDRCHWGQ